MISLAPFNCLRDDWIEHYYPDDLPVDWRLDFYANEYRTLFVPADIRARPEFLLEEFPQFEQVVREWDGGEEQSALIAEGTDVYLSMNQAVAAKPAAVLDAVPDGQLAALVADNGGEPLYFLQSAGDLRQLRNEFEVTGAAAGESSALVFLDASPAVLEQAKTLLDLLGQLHC